MNARVETDVAGRTFSLRRALLQYESGGGEGYVSLHDIQMLGKRPVLGPGSPATKAGLRELLYTLAPGTRPKPEFIPEHVLCHGPDHVVWWAKPAHRTLWFNCKEIGNGEVSGRVPLPGLVFAVVGGEWYVFAVKGDARPVPETVLCRSPFLNTWAGGHICTGNITTPNTAAAETTAAWEESFYNSFFTHSNIHAPAKLVMYKGGGYAFWEDMLAGQFKEFPERVLITERHNPPSKTTVRLGDLILGIGKQIGGGR